MSDQDTDLLRPVIHDSDEKKSQQKPDTEAELEIEVVDDTPEKDKKRVLDPPDDNAEPTEEELQSYSDSVRKRIRKLTHDRHRERMEKERLARENSEATNMARKLFEENQRLQASLHNGETAYFSQHKTLAEKELAQAKLEYTQAFEAGDGMKMAEAQDAIAAARLKIAQAESFKPSPLPQKQNLEYSDANTQPPAQKHQPVNQPDAKVLEWKANNEWFGQNKRMTSFALGVHQELVDEGVQVGSDEYYAKIDREMRKTFPDSFDDIDPPKQKPKAGTVVAPVSRSTSPGKVKLTQTQVAVAKKLGVPLDVYAKHVQLLEKK